MLNISSGKNVNSIWFLLFALLSCENLYTAYLLLNTSVFELLPFVAFVGIELYQFLRKVHMRSFFTSTVFLLNIIFLLLYYGGYDSTSFFLVPYLVFLFLGTGFSLKIKLSKAALLALIYGVIYFADFKLEESIEGRIPVSIYLGLGFFALFLFVDKWRSKSVDVTGFSADLTSDSGLKLSGSWRLDLFKKHFSVDESARKILFSLGGASDFSTETLHKYLDQAGRKKLDSFVVSLMNDRELRTVELKMIDGETVYKVILSGRKNSYSKNVAEGFCIRKSVLADARNNQLIQSSWFVQSLVGAVLLDESYVIAKVNDKLAQLLGYETSDLVAKSLHEITLKEDHGIDAANFFAIQEGKVNTYTVDKRVYDRTGKQRWFHLNFIRQCEDELCSTVVLFEEFNCGEDSDENTRVDKTLLRGVFQSLNSLVFNFSLKDKRSEVLEVVNGTFAGHNFEELNAKNLFSNEYIGEDFLLGLEVKFGELSRRETALVRDFELRFLDKNDAYVWVSFSCQLTNPDELLCVFRDITDKKKTELDLYQNSMLLSEAERASGMGTWEMDMVTEELTWSQEVKKNHGMLITEQPTFRESLSFFNISSRQKFEDYIYSAMRSNLPFDDEFEILDTKGINHQVRITGRPIAIDGRVIKITGLFQSVDEKRLTQSRLNSLRNQLVNAQRNANIGSWEYNYLTRIFQCSEEMKHILKVPFEQSLTKDEFESYYTAESRILIERATDNSIRQKLTYDREIEVFTSVGTKKWVRAIGTPNFEQGELVSFTGTFQDIDATKKTAIKVQEQTERYIAATEGSTDAFMILSAVLNEDDAPVDFQLLEFNTAAIKLIPDIISVTKHSSIKRYLPNALFKRLLTVFKVGRTYDNEVKVSADYINSTWINLTVVRVTNGIAITIRDITDRKEASLRMKQQSERYIAATEGGFDAFFIIRPFYNDQHELNDFQVLESNSVFAGLVGRNIDENIDGELMSELLPLYRDMGLYERFQRVLLKNEPLREEFLLDISDVIGESRWISLKVIKISDGIAVTFTDINDRKIAELRLAETYGDLENIKKALDESTLTSVFDPAGFFISVNVYFESITGYKTDSIQGIHYRDFFIEIANGSVIELFHSLRSGDIWSGEIKCLGKGGKEMWLDTVIKPILDEDGGVLEYLTIQKNITERKRIEAEREVLIAELISNNKDLEQFTYITSHNLRAPIASMLGLISLYGRYDDDPVLQKDIVDKLRVSAETLDNTFRDLNQMLEIRKNLNEIKEDVNFDEVVKNVMVSLSSQIKETEAEIDIDFSHRNIIFTIKSYAESILINLIGNAIKYKHPDRHPVIKLYTQETNEYVVLYVEDNGLGIDLDRYGDHLFRLYSRFHLHKEGKGIGLHLVKNQADAMGGKVEVDSRLDKGTTFMVFFKK